MERYFEWTIGVIGGIIGWFVGKFEPTFPLIYVAIAFIVYDSWTAYELDKRVKKRYPDKKKRPAAYVSYKAWGMVPTMIESFTIILLMYAAQRWIFVDFYVPLSYIATGVICGVQLLSIAENKSSCRTPQDKGWNYWKIMAKVLIDKTERHFDVHLDDLKEGFDKETNLEN
jgi:hypothetical protein